jgi:tetratricopeptide (TPR) repeat protein
MKSYYKYTNLLLFLGLNIGYIFAQNTLLIEENNLAFQNNFFEALKQKAIKNYSRAIEKLENCYQLDSSNTAVQFELAKNYFLLKRNFEAIVFINKALYKKPNNIYLLQQKVAIFKAEQNFKEAIKIQQKIIKIQPNLSNDLVQLYILNHNYDKAKKLIIDIENKALSNLNTKKLAQYLKSKSQLKINNKKQVDDAHEFVNIETEIAQYNKTKKYNALLNIINSYIQKKQFSKLEKITKSELDLFPSQPYLYYANGLALTKLKKYNNAVEILLLGIDFVMDDALIKTKFYKLLATCYAAMNQTKEAIKYKQKATILRKQ